MIDLHSHILPGLDDGAQSEEDTLRMAELYQSYGFTRVVASPHIRENSEYLVRKEDLEEMVADWNHRFQSMGINLQLLPGAEYYLDGSFSELAERLWPIIRLNNSYYTLVEMPVLFLPKYLGVSFFNPQIHNPELKKLIPFLRLILAHPERNEEVLKNPQLALRELKEQGLYIQINLGSLVGLYGKLVKKTAELFVKRNLTDLIATDAHSPEQLERILSEGIPRLKKLLGEKRFNLLMKTNPELVLAGEPLEPIY